MTKDQTPSREEVIRWARESGLHLPYWADDEDPEKDPPRWTMVSPLPPPLERFAALVAAAEREAMVALAAKQGWAMKNEDLFEDAVREIAAIRARGQA